MIKGLLKCLRGIAVTVFLSLYLFATYELLILPAVLDWSAYGVLLSLILGALLIWSIPAGQRLSTAVLGFVFLMMLQALHNIAVFPLWKEFFGGLFIFIILLIVSRLLGKVSFRKYLTVFLAAVILNGTVNLAQVPFWSEFAVKWESPALYERYGTVDYFPLTLADLDGDGTKEIITQQNLAGAQNEQLLTATAGRQHRILEPESNYYAVYKWDGDTFQEISPDSYSLNKLNTLRSVDYIGFPFYTVTEQLDKTQGLRQNMTPLLDRSDLAEEAVKFGRFPFSLLKMDMASMAAKSLDLPTEINPLQTPALVHDNFVSGQPLEEASINSGLTVRQQGAAGPPLAAIGSREIPDIGIGEMVAADIDNDGTKEILLTVENSRILKLADDGKWHTLWVSPEAYNPKTRFQKFRFEDFNWLGKNASPEIIALAKSNVRENPTRYVTGYTYVDGRLKQTWRVFTGLINLRAGDIDGDGENELVGYMYRGHRVLVLEKHNLPVVQGLYLVSGLLIAAGFWRQRKSGRNGKTTMAILLLVSFLTFAGCSVSSGPREFATTQPSDYPAAPEAEARLIQAFNYTAEKGTKFMYSGHAVTRVQKRNVGFYASGSYDQEKGYNMDGRIFGQPFRFYRWGSETYVSAEDKWKKADKSTLPLVPFAELPELQLPFDKAVKLPDADILGKKCDVFMINLSSQEAINAARSMGIQMEKDPEKESEMPGETQMTLTFWIGKLDQGSFLYQYKTEVSMPVTYAGTMFQEVLFRFWNFNDQGIKIQSPDKIAPYLVK